MKNQYAPERNKELAHSDMQNHLCGSPACAHSRSTIHKNENGEWAGGKGRVERMFGNESEIVTNAFSQY